MLYSELVLKDFLHLCSSHGLRCITEFWVLKEPDNITQVVLFVPKCRLFSPLCSSLSSEVLNEQNKFSLLRDMGARSRAKRHRAVLIYVVPCCAGFDRTTKQGFCLSVEVMSKLLLARILSSFCRAEETFLGACFSEESPYV